MGKVMVLVLDIRKATLMVIGKVMDMVVKDVDTNCSLLAHQMGMAVVAPLGKAMVTLVTTMVTDIPFKSPKMPLEPLQKQKPSLGVVKLSGSLE